jgi:hypothetical protein
MCGIGLLPFIEKLGTMIIFSQAITELLWSPQIHSQVRCSIYQDIFNRNGDHSLHSFLRYATMAANLTLKMSELEIMDAIGGHYLNYI